MKVTLHKPKNNNGCKAVWTHCQPFVVNSRATLIHRPKRISTYQLEGRKPHIAVEYWCGNTQAGNDKFTFVDSPPVDRLVCNSCEQRALMAGEMSSSEIVGTHIHTGRLVASQVCCK